MQASTFSEGLMTTSFPELFKMQVYRQNDFNQEVYEQTILHYPKLVNLDLIFTGIEDLSQLSSNLSIKYVSVLSYYDIILGNVESEIGGFKYFRYHNQ